MKRNDLLLAPVLALAMSADLQSQVLPFEATEKTLANGLKVIVVPTGFPNIVSVQIPVQTGSRNEIEPGDVLLIEASNSPGELARIAHRLARGKINIEYCYSATPTGAKKGLLILRVANPRKALRILNS